MVGGSRSGGAFPFFYQFVPRVAVIAVLPAFLFSLSFSPSFFFHLHIGDFFSEKSVYDTTIYLYDSLEVWRVSSSTVWRWVHHSTWRTVGGRSWSLSSAIRLGCVARVIIISTANESSAYSVVW